MRELFSKLQFLDPGLRSRLLTWLAYHLSNFNFQVRVSGVQGGRLTHICTQVLCCLPAL